MPSATRKLLSRSLVFPRNCLSNAKCFLLGEEGTQTITYVLFGVSSPASKQLNKRQGADFFSCQPRDTFSWFIVHCNQDNVQAYGECAFARCELRFFPDREKVLLVFIQKVSLAVCWEKTTQLKFAWNVRWRMSNTSCWLFCKKNCLHRRFFFAQTASRGLNFQHCPSVDSHKRGFVWQMLEICNLKDKSGARSTLILFLYLDCRETRQFFFLLFSRVFTETYEIETANPFSFQDILGNVNTCSRKDFALW